LTCFGYVMVGVFIGWLMFVCFGLFSDRSYWDG